MQATSVLKGVFPGEGLRYLLPFFRYKICLAPGDKGVLCCSLFAVYAPLPRDLPPCGVDTTRKCEVLQQIPTMARFEVDFQRVKDQGSPKQLE